MQDLVGVLEQDHFFPQPLQDHAHFQRDHARAEHGHGPHGSVTLGVPELRVGDGPVAGEHLGQVVAGELGAHGARADGDQQAFAFDLFLRTVVMSNGHFFGSFPLGDDAGPAQDFDAGHLHQLGVALAQRVDHALEARPQPFARPLAADHVGIQGLGGDAAAVQAGAAEMGFFHQRDLHAVAGRQLRGARAAGAAAEDDQIIHMSSSCHIAKNAKRSAAGSRLWRKIPRGAIASRFIV